MRITVLGKSPAWQDAGGACSGYLVEEDGYALLLDCGNGVFSKLRRYRDYVDVDAVLISHLHADHFLDLIPFSYALSYAPRQQPVAVAGWPGTDSPARPQLHAPMGAGDLFRQLVSMWGDEALIERAFALQRVRRPRRAQPRADQRALLRGAALHAHVRGRAPRAGRAADLQRRLQSERPARGVRRRYRSARDRGDAAATRADRSPRSPHTGRGGRPRPARRRAAGRAHPLLRRARR